METIFLNPTSGLTHECAETGHCCACRSWLTCILIVFVKCSDGSPRHWADTGWTDTGLDPDSTGIQVALALLRHGTECPHTLSSFVHINKIVLKMSHCQELCTFYSFVTALSNSLFMGLCHLDYCSIIWSSASKQLTRKLHVRQNINFLLLPFWRVQLICVAIWVGSMLREVF